MRIIHAMAAALLLASGSLFALPDFIADLYPSQNALNIPADIELRVVFANPIDAASISDSSIYIYSDITGMHKWEWELDENGMELILRPKHWWGVGDVPFNAGERVSTTLTTRLRYMNGEAFEGFTWFYTVSVRQNYGGHFTPYATFGGAQLYGFYIADFNGDRAPDLAAHDSFQDQLAIFLNDGRGRFDFAFYAPGWGAGGGTQTVDYDRNGGIDVPIGMRIIKFNNGNANFTSKKILPAWVEGYRLYDFNNDGIFDVVANVPNRKHGIKIGLSKWQSAYIDTQTIAAPFQPRYYYQIELYDLDNDGKRDIIAPGVSLPNRSFIGFATVLMKESTPLKLHQIENSHALSVAGYANDLNNDGFIDYAFIGGPINPYQPYYISYMNDKTGHLIPRGLKSDSTQGYDGGAGGDIDGDGDIDFFLKSSLLFSAMPEMWTSRYNIAVNNGDGVFEWQGEQTLPFDSIGVRYEQQARMVDLDLDGDLDVMLNGPGVFMVIANESYVSEVNEFDKTSPVSPAIRLSNYPNPFNTATTIRLFVARRCKNAVVKIYNPLGQIVISWDLSQLRPGEHEFVWDGRSENGLPVSSGLYFIRIQAPEYSRMIKAVAVR